MAKKASTPATQAEAKPPALYDYGETEGKGFENQTQDDIKIPLLLLLQVGSPQVVEGDLKAGHLFNSVTEEASEEVLFVPSVTRHSYIEWVPRDKGGGFVAVHALNSPVVTQAQTTAKAEGKNINELSTPEGNDLVETFEMIGVTYSKEGEPLGMLVIPFTSTKIKVYRGINTRLQTFRVPTEDGRKVNPPLFAHTLRISSVTEENKHGKFFNFKVTSAAENLKDSLIPADDPRFLAAQEVYDLVQEGKATAAHETAAQSEDPGENMPF